MATIEAGKRLTEATTASVHINVVSPIRGPDGATWQMVQFFHSPDPPPATCPQGHGATVGDQPGYVPDARGWPVCQIDGYDSSPMARAQAGEDVIKQPVYVPVSAPVAQVVARITARAVAARSERDRRAALYARVLVDPADPSMAVRVREVTALDASQAGGTALRRVAFDRLRATLDGVRVDSLEVLVAADAAPAAVHAAMVAAATIARNQAR